MPVLGRVIFFSSPTQLLLFALCFVQILGTNATLTFRSQIRFGHTVWAVHQNVFLLQIRTSQGSVSMEIPETDYFTGGNSESKLVRKCEHRTMGEVLAKTEWGFTIPHPPASFPWETPEGGSTHRRRSGSRGILPLAHLPQLLATIPGKSCFTSPGQLSPWKEKSTGCKKELRASCE